MDKTEALKKAIEFSKKARQFLIFKRAVLFGSYVNGNPREDSDIDIAFFVKNIDDNIDYYSLLVNLNRLAGKIDSRIEPHIFTSNSISGFSEMIQLHSEEILVDN
jgi:predicted nucleotidyltransferase